MIQDVSRRNFIKGVVATGAVATSASYLFRQPTTLLGQGGAANVERLLTLNVNGQQRRVDVMKQDTLAMTLRYKLGLTGTKLGCDRAECGACTVLIDDVPHYSCSVLTHTVRNKRVVTIEGLASPTGVLHPVQQAVVDEHVARQLLRCGVHGGLRRFRRKMGARHGRKSAADRQSDIRRTQEPRRSDGESDRRVEGQQSNRHHS